MALHPIRDIGLISVSVDLGAGRRGVDMGPSALRIAGLGSRLEKLGYTVREFGTVHAQEPEITELGETKARFLPEIVDVTRRTYALVREAMEEGHLPLVLGGDHSLSIATVAAAANHHHEASDDPVGLIWVDAHSDMNTPETTPSGNIHGMPLSILIGEGPEDLVRLGNRTPAVDPDHVSILGVRDVDGPERERVRASGVRAFSMTELDERGVAVCMEEALERATRGTSGFHLSLDLDVVDPLIAPGVGTPVPGGITYREAHLICEKAARTQGLVALELVELNPVLDLENRTARLAVGLLESALGRTIL